MATCTGKEGCKGKIILDGMCCRHVKQQCSICLENIDIGITTNCKHHYHHGCINLYIFNIIQSNTDLDFKCPLCRTDIL